MLNFGESEPLSLARIEVGRRGRIVALATNRSVRRQLVAHGLTPGEEVTVLQRGRAVPLVVQRTGCAIMVDLRLAKSVIVEEVAE